MGAVADRRPDVALPGGIARAVQDRDRRLVPLDHFRLEHFLVHQFDQGFEELGALLEPAAERAPRDQDVGSGQLVLLAIQRHVLDELADQDKARSPGAARPPAIGPDAVGAVVTPSLQQEHAYLG